MENNHTPSTTKNSQTKPQWEEKLAEDFNCAKYHGLPDGYSDWENFDFALKAFIRSLLHTAKQEGAKNLADKIDDQMAEFGDNPKDALACIEETINMWFMTPEQQREYNEGHDY